jgi:hypothetical protein
MASRIGAATSWMAETVRRSSQDGRVKTRLTGRQAGPRAPGTVGDRTVAGASPGWVGLPGGSGTAVIAGSAA